MQLQTLLEDFHSITHIPITYSPAHKAAGMLHFTTHADTIMQYLSLLRQSPALKEKIATLDAEALAQVTKPPGTVHSYEPAAGLTTFVFPVYSRQMLLGSFVLGPLRIGQQMGHYEQSQRAILFSAHHLDANTMEALYQQLPVFDQPALIAASHLLSQVVEYASNMDALTLHALPLSERIVNYINTQYMNAISPATACEHFHISRTTLSRTLSRAFNDTFLSMLNQRRIKHVCQCLDEGRSIEEAATQSGFSTPLYMTRVFHKLMGCTPHIYQKTAQQPHERS